MLRKLLKHEFRATGRIMLPLYLILLATSVGANVSVRKLLEERNAIMNVLGGLLAATFIVAIIAVCVVNMVVMVQRFYKNLLQDEGYVMMTLPCSIHQHIWSKLIVSAVWFALTIVAVLLACLIMAADVTAIQIIADVVKEILRALTHEYSLDIAAFTVEFLLMCFLGSCAMCLEFYASLAIGHSRPAHKMAWSVLAFFVMWFAMQLLISVLVVTLDETSFYYFLMKLTDIQGPAGLHSSFWFFILCEILYGAVFYFLTTYFLKRHLNLE